MNDEHFSPLKGNNFCFNNSDNYFNFAMRYIFAWNLISWPSSPVVNSLITVKKKIHQHCWYSTLLQKRKKCYTTMPLRYATFEQRDNSTLFKNTEKTLSISTSNNNTISSKRNIWFTTSLYSTSYTSYYKIPCVYNCLTLGAFDRCF